MKPARLVFLALFLVFFPSRGQDQTWPQGSSAGADAVSAADRLFEEGSYTLALEEYRKLADAPGSLRAEESRRLAFRVADCGWRGASSNWSEVEKARKTLEELAKVPERPEERDQLWAEIQESLGDLWSLRQRPDPQQAGRYYDAALDWWAGARASEVARDRYLRIIWKRTEPTSVSGYGYGYRNATRLPLEKARNVLKLARTDIEKARAHGLVADALSQRGNPTDVPRIAEEFESALAPGRADAWYGETLMAYAAWLTRGGRIVPDKEGVLRVEPDFVKAVEQYRRVLHDFKKTETSRVSEAQRALDEITKPVATLSVANTFLPGSEVEVRFSWRNVPKMDLTLHELRFDALPLEGREQVSGGWLAGLDLTRLPVVRSWSRATGDLGEHRPSNDVLRLDPKLGIGAYLLTATSAAGTARELILVTDTALVVKHTRNKTFVWATDAISGEPLPGARVHLWSAVRREKATVWHGREAETNSEGIATVEWSQPVEWVTVMAAKGDRQAYASGGAYGQPAERETWRVFAFADRPAYRPGETVRWKAIARTSDGTSYETPSGRSIGYSISGPQRAKVSEGTLTLNEFGSGWATLDLGADLPLGEYRIAFNHGYESAVLFRVEEYKLPEFRVSVETPMTGGHRKVFRHGDRVEAVVRAIYYSGGPVAGANVEVLVNQRGYQFGWEEPDILAWYGVRSFAPFRERGQTVERLTARTGSDGTATVSFETKKDEYRDVEYGLEARVTDSSRREVVAEGRVRLARQLFFARLKAARNLCRPGESVALRIETRDANEQPVSGTGVVTITRQTWNEEWIDPNGKTWRGPELRDLQEKLPTYGFYNIPGWRNVSRDYKKETVVSGRVGTSPEGLLETPFTPDLEGYYSVTFVPDDGQRGGGVITSATGIWATRRETVALGYQPLSGLELITDKPSYRPGDVAQVLVSARSANRWLLFTTEADAVETSRVLKMTGDVLLLEVPIDEKLTPNAMLTATTIREGKVLIASKELTVPPLQHFFDLSVRPCLEDVRPGQELTLELTAKDHQGRPVAAELGVGVVDDSVSYVQKDLSGDPRPFFHGTRRTLRVQTQTSMQQKIYARYVVGPDGKLEEEAVAALRARVAPTPTPAAPIAGPVLNIVGTARSADTVTVYGAMGLENSYNFASAVVVTGEAPAVDLAKSMSVARDEAREPSVQVRTDFRSTAFWQPDVETDADGRATISLRVPDSLTTWKVTARGSTAGDQYGLASNTFRVNLPVMVRLEAPRFLVVGDTATLSAVIDNTTAAPMRVRPSLEARGLDVSGIAPETVTVPANGSTRVDWSVVARLPGEVQVKVVARGERESDAMERKMPVREHGIEKVLATAEKMTGSEATLFLTLPERRDATMTVQVEPSLAGAMLGALPYLLDYPYGCVEQTMSRFLPAAIVGKSLTDLGLSPEDVSARILARAAPVDETGAPRRPRDPKELDRIVEAGLARLSDMQHADGGWGWWKADTSDAYMTAYVVWGLSLGKAAGVHVQDELLSKGAASLAGSLENVDLGLETQAWLLHALAQIPPELRSGAAPRVRKTFDRLWERRARLSPYSVALLTLAAKQLGRQTAAETLARNLKNGVKRDRVDVSKIASNAAVRSSGSATATAHWGGERGWHWWQSRVETTAFVLRALVAVDPDDELIEPAAAWLVRNRRAGRFTNTRDTAIAVLALDEVLASRGRTAPMTEVSYEVEANGAPVVKRSLAGAEALLSDGLVEIDPALLRDGSNEVRVRRSGGTSPLWVSASARFFSLEEPIRPAGSGLFVKRQYFRMKPVQTLLKGTTFEREELADGAEVASGERIETILTLEAKNDYEYLLVEDLKPAGFEAVQVRSGEPLLARELNVEGVERKHGAAGHQRVARDTSRTVPADTTERTESIHQELRDRKVALFLTRLPEGIWEVRYDLRAEAPGRFHALPVIGSAMYAPEIRGNGEEQRLTVRERPE